MLYLSYFGLKIWIEMIFKSKNYRVWRCIKGIFFDGFEIFGEFYWSCEGFMVNYNFSFNKK